MGKKETKLRNQESENDSGNFGCSQINEDQVNKNQDS